MNLKVKKIFVFILLLILLNVQFNNVYGLVNEGYLDNSVEETKEEVNQKLESSVFTKPISYLVYSIASASEYFIGKIFSALTGSESFPWADKLIFNAVPLLDINFITPSEGSLFETADRNILNEIIMRIYYTIFGLAIAFFSVAIAAMTIKLIIATLAEDKARYKSSLTQSFVALLILFTIHFAIAFIFHANEQLVQIASNIAIDNMESIEMPNIEEILGLDERITRFIEANTELFTNHSNIKEYLLASDKRKKIVNNMLNSTVLMQNLNPDSSTNFSLLERTNNDAVILVYELTQILDNESSYDLIKEIDELLDKYESQQEGAFADPNSGETYNNIIGKIEALGGYYPADYDSVGYANNIKSINEYVKEGKVEVVEIDNKNKIKFKWGINSSYPNLTPSQYFSMMSDFVKSIENEEIETGKSNSFISELGLFFKQSAWAYGENSWTNNELTLQGAILYAIFVFQSIFIFIAYLRRFFYIIILAVLAPIIVVFDFFLKSLQK